MCDRCLMPVRVEQFAGFCAGSGLSEHALHHFHGLVLHAYQASVGVAQ